MSQKVLVFIRVGFSKVQECRNALARQKSVLQVYDGRVLGVGDLVEILDGDWPEHLAVIVLEFESEFGAVHWLQSDELVKQQDFMGQSDIIIVPKAANPGPHKSWICLSDIHVYNQQIFEEQYVPKAKDILQDVGAAVHIVNSCQVTSFRGHWHPERLIVNQFASREQYINTINSDQAANADELRIQSAEGITVLFELDPLVKEGVAPIVNTLDFSTYYQQ